MARRLHISGKLEVVDDEPRNNEEEFVDRFDVNKVIENPGSVNVFDQEPYHHYAFKCGGEIRIEIYLMAFSLPSDEIQFMGVMHLYEGVSENTMDLDGVKSISFKVKPNKHSTRLFVVRSDEFNSDDRAYLRLECSNTSVN